MAQRHTFCLPTTQSQWKCASSKLFIQLTLVSVADTCSNFVELTHSFLRILLTYDVFNPKLSSPAKTLTEACAVIWDTKPTPNQYGKICIATKLFVCTCAKHISLSAANIYHHKSGTLHTLDNQVVFICLPVESSRRHPFKDTSILSFQTYHFKRWVSSHVSACTKLSLQHIWLTSWWRTTSLLSDYQLEELQFFFVVQAD